MNGWMNSSLLGSQRRLSCELRLKDEEKVFSRHSLKENKEEEVRVFI